jgi:glycosyltransferase involved in cell wall biosynthesis
MSAKRKDGALFIMPRPSSAWRGSEALWITVAGWSAAASRLLGNAWVLTTDAIVSPETAAQYPVRESKPQTSSARGWWVPKVLITLAKDIRLWQSRNRKSYTKDVPWKGLSLEFVWEQHDLFHGPGRRIADELGVPLVIFVHAPIVWEASRWGVQRPIWGKLLEIFSESRSLRKADLVACVSEEVAARVQSMGVAHEKIMVSPMSVDPRPFALARGTDRIRKRLGLEDKVVIGWTGSFRAFHGLEGLMNAFSKLATDCPNVCFMLVGDGPERRGVEELADRLNLRHLVFFPGKVSFDEIPAYVSTFDIAVVSTGVAADFHYSPLKLREYLAAGCAVVAPRAGEIPSRFKEDSEILLYTPGDEEQLREKLRRLVMDTSLRSRIADAGMKRVLESGTWDFELGSVMGKLSHTP